MELRVLDTILVTAIRNGVLRRGEVVAVAEDLAVSLLQTHPAWFAQVDRAPAAVARAEPRRRKSATTEEEKSE